MPPIAGRDARHWSLQPGRVCAHKCMDSCFLHAKIALTVISIAAISNIIIAPSTILPLVSPMHLSIKTRKMDLFCSLLLPQFSTWDVLIRPQKHVRHESVTCSVQDNWLL